MKEPISAHPRISTWLEHIKAISVGIGPRGSTRPGERQAAEYAFEQFEKAGLKPVLETFQSAKSIFLPHLIGSSLILLAFLVFPLGGRLTAAISAAITILALISELRELGFANNLFRMLVPKGESQNVFAVIPPSGEHHSDLVLVGHLDSQRTPIIFRSATWVKIYDKFTTVAFVTFILQAVLYSLAVFFPWSWIWLTTILTALSALLLAGMCIQADLTPFTAGANDNASAVGMVLTLAEELAKQPLEHTRVYAVCSGCEEVQHYGMIDFYKRHKNEMKAARAVVFEMLGCAGPAWLTQEGIIIPFKADPVLCSILEKLAAANPGWGAYPVKVSGGNTEMADALRVGIPAIAIFGMTSDGEAPYWHQKEDTFDKMNPEVMQRTWELTRAYLKELDQ
jgi:hypothetical protein